MRQAVVVDAKLALKGAADIMSKKRISSLIVLDGEKVSGIITKNDLVRNFGKKASVKSVMVKEVIVVDPEMSTLDAVELMREKQVGTLPVVNNGVLVGVVSAKDLLKESCDTDDFMFE